MIFSHFRKPTGMRKTRLGKRISVHRVPLDTSWFCPYCCATVDTAFVTLQRHRERGAYTSSPNPSVGSLWRFVLLHSCVRTQPQRDVGWLHRLPYHPHQIVAQGLKIRLVPELGRKCL